MNRLFVSLLALILMVSLWSFAPENEKLKVHYTGRTFWIDDSTSIRGQYYTDVVEANLKNSIYVKDSLGKKYKVESFDLYYKEVGVFEDENGKPKIMVEINSSHIEGNTIDSMWQLRIHERLAWGDTLIFDAVKYHKGKTPQYARPLKIFMKRKPKTITIPN